MNATGSVIDIHCHTAGIGAGGSGCFISPAMRGNIRYRFFLRAFGVSSRELERHGDPLILERLSARLHQSRHVRAAVVLALDGVRDSRGELDISRTELYIPNDYLARECRRRPNLLFGASINPLRPDALDELERVAAQGAVLLKWLPSIQGFDPADPRLAAFYRQLHELGLPLLTHTGNEESFTRADNSLADPLRLRRPLEAGVTVIAAHCASNGRNLGEHNLERLLPLFNEFPHLFADISALTQVNRLGHLQKVLRHTEINDRLLYGSDMPIIATAATSPLFHGGSVPPRTLLRLLREENPWDRDVELKLALGMPEEILGRVATVLRLKEHDPADPSSPSSGGSSQDR
ncbi:MAG TPA: amidohydrolase family protein [Geobacteraceae bacterium]|nr:amidohydrolase family protein [Geobacteraceae bacterium]